MRTSESLRERLKAGSGVDGWWSDVREAVEWRVLAREVVEALESLSRRVSNLRFVVARAGSWIGAGEDAAMLVFMRRRSSLRGGWA
jgi:hypothetical protein